MNPFIGATIATGILLAVAGLFIGWIVGTLNLAAKQSWPAFPAFAVAFAPLAALIYVAVAAEMGAFG